MNITAGTIARTACLALALINQVLTVAGHSPIPVEDEALAQLIALTFTIGTSVTAWWKNNSFTSAAIEADEVKNQRKAGI